jgi:hypothetical protein
MTSQRVGRAITKRKANIKPFVITKTTTKQKEPENMTQQMIRHDLEIDYCVSAYILGGLLLCIDEDTSYNDSTGETTITAVNSVEVVGFHLGANVCLTRDQMIQMLSKAHIDFIETVQLEERKEAIG